jgi:hypothetical protein
VTTPTIRDHCATLAGDVDYLLTCIEDGSSDPITLEEIFDRLITARDLLAAEPAGEGPRELQCPASVARGCHEAAAEAESGSPLQQLLVASGDLLERCRPAAPPAPPGVGEVGEVAAYLHGHGRWLIQSGYANASIETRDLGIRVFRVATLLQQRAAPAQPHSQPPPRRPLGPGGV